MEGWTDGRTDGRTFRQTDRPPEKDREGVQRDRQRKIERGKARESERFLALMDQLQRESRKGSIRREQTKGGSERTRNLDNNFLGFPVPGLCPYRFRKALELVQGLKVSVL